MTPVTTMPIVGRSRARSRLRLVAYDRRRPAAPTATGNVLVAGTDRPTRVKMLEELRGVLPEGTPFVEAEEAWQVVAQAGESRMAILTGDLHDISAKGLMRVLGRRYPLLPVIALSGQRQAPDQGELGAASP